MKDALAGALSNTYQSPRLSIANPKLLGKGTKNLKLVRKVTTTIEVSVKNSGTVPAKNVRVSAKGKGITAKTVKVTRAKDPRSLAPEPIGTRGSRCTSQ